MYIGEIAKETGLSIKAIRFYEEKGLLIPLPRKGIYRVYNQSHIEILNLVKQEKSLGASLSQLKDVIVYNDGEVDWPTIEKFLQEIKGQLALQIIDLKNKAIKVDQCLLEINSCALVVDSPLRGRD